MLLQDRQSRLGDKPLICRILFFDLLKGSIQDSLPSDREVLQPVQSAHPADSRTFGSIRREPHAKCAIADNSNSVPCPHMWFRDIAFQSRKLRKTPADM